MMLHQEEIFLFFRLGLVTGILETKTLIAWADREIETNPNFSEEVVELSLSSNRPLSEILWVLSSFVIKPKFDRPLKLLFAAAGLLLEENETRSAEIISDLLLVTAETLISQNTKLQMVLLENYRTEFRQKTISLSDLTKKLSGFLNPYSVYRPQLIKIIVGS